jgi:hypothetical protein
MRGTRRGSSRLGAAAGCTPAVYPICALTATAKHSRIARHTRGDPALRTPQNPNQPAMVLLDDAPDADGLPRVAVFLPRDPGMVHGRPIIRVCRGISHAAATVAEWEARHAR